jgi:hypothetical protein
MNGQGKHRTVYTQWRTVAMVTLLATASACGGGSQTPQNDDREATFTIGGPFGRDESGIGCDFEGNAVVVRDGTGPIVGTTVMKMTDKDGSGDNCFGQASWSVEVPKADFYRIEMESDLSGRQIIKSDLIPFDEIEAADFVLYLKTEIDGLDELARVVGSG